MEENELGQPDPHHATCVKCGSQFIVKPPSTVLFNHPEISTIFVTHKEASVCVCGRRYAFVINEQLSNIELQLNLLPEERKLETPTPPPLIFLPPGAGTLGGH